MSLTLTYEECLFCLKAYVLELRAQGANEVADRIEADIREDLADEHM